MVPDKETHPHGDLKQSCARARVLTYAQFRPYLLLVTLGDVGCCCDLTACSRKRQKCIKGTHQVGAQGLVFSLHIHVPTLLRDSQRVHMSGLNAFAEKVESQQHAGRGAAVCAQKHTITVSVGVTCHPPGSSTISSTFVILLQQLCEALALPPPDRQ